MPAEERERVAFAADFRVGEWLVEPSLDRLSRNGAVVRLRPQLTNLLVLLAAHAGRTVSKDEILSKVWEGQFVAESGMTRCIAEIRQALQDDAREPKIIETIPKRGYRLVAPVAFLDAGPAHGPGEQQSLPPPLAGSEAAVRDTAPVPGDEVQEAEAVRVHAAGLGPGLRWTRRPVLGLALLLALTWTAVGWTPTPVLSQRDTVLLADVTNTTGDPVFDQTLRLALAVHLGQAPFLRLLPAEQVRAALARMGRSHDQPLTGATALDLCRREAAAVLLAGSVAKVGSHYAVGIEAIACRSGESVGRELVEVESKDRVLAALGAAARRVRRTLGESRSSLRQYDVPIIQGTTRSLEALKALSLGDLSRDHAELNGALVFYRRATELDPEFALAWARRGAAARNVGQSVNEARFGGLDEPTYSFTKAYDLRGRVSGPERFYILAHYYRFVAGDPERAVETYKTWKRMYPGSSVPPTNLAALYVNVFGQYDAALPEAQEAVRLSPYSSIATKALVLAYLGTNRAADARQALREAAGRGAADLVWHDLAFQVAFADRDAAGMEEQARWALGDAAAAAIITQQRARAASSEGRLREARQRWPEAAGAAAQSGRAAWHSAIKLAEAQTEAVLGDAPAARAAAAAAVALEQEAGTLLHAAISVAISGDVAGAGKLIEAAARHAKPGTCTNYVWRPMARALMEAGAGRREQALEILHTAAPYERGAEFGLAPMVVRASIQLAAGAGSEAAGTFREVLSLAAVAPTSPWVTYARLGLARALRDAGDIQGSRAAYDALIDWMRNGDVDAPLLVAAKRERAALQSR